MKRFLLLTALLAITATAMSGKSISRSQALDNANKYCAERGINITIAATAQPARVQATTAMAEQPYYVFSTNDAFVIAAGDDEYPAVLGYSDNGAFDPDDVPEALQELLMQYADIIANDGVGDIIVPPSRVQAVEPLCKTTWSQRAPYNNQCPEVTTGKQGVAGCVATAMGQVMYYHRWPDNPTSNIPAYHTRTKGISIAELDPTKYPAWSSLQDHYPFSQVSQGINTEAIGWFMRYVWQSVEMDFKDSSSGAYNSSILTALPSYFDYDRSVHSVNQEYFTHTGWFNLVTKELNNHRPILYSGSKYLGGGHEFIVDGVNADGMVHVNWGWGGTSNGYFALAYLNPDSQGAGSSSGDQGYNKGNSMIIDIKKATESSSSALATFCCHYVTASASSLTRPSAFANFPSFEVSSRFINTYSFSQQADIGWAISYNGSVNILTSRTTTLPAGYYVMPTMSITLPDDLPMGTYIIYPVCKPQGGTRWTRALGDASYITVVVTATKATITCSGNAAALNYAISNVQVGDKREVGRNLEVTATVTNSGNSNIANLYMLYDGAAVTHAICDAEPGASANLTWNHTPTSTGTHTIAISLNEDGSNPLYSGSVTIGAASNPSISATTSVTVANANDNREIEGNTFAATVTLKNSGTTTFNDDIIAVLYYRLSTTTAAEYANKTIPITLNSKATKTVSVSFDNLPPNNYYLRFKYYTGGELTNLAASTVYTVLGSSYATGDVNGDGNIDIIDANAVVNVVLGNEPASNYGGRADVNGDGEVNIVDINTIINIILS